MEIFSARLKFLREKKKYTNEEIAYRLDISETYYKDIENGIYEPELNILARFPIILGESVDFLIGATDLDTSANMYVEESTRSLLGALVNQANIIKAEKTFAELNGESLSPLTFESEDAAIKYLLNADNSYNEKQIHHNDILFAYLNSIPYIKPRTIEGVKIRIRQSALFQIGSLGGYAFNHCYEQ